MKKRILIPLMVGALFVVTPDASASCSCDMSVMKEYAKVIGKVKTYYQELQAEIDTLVAIVEQSYPYLQEETSRQGMLKDLLAVEAVALKGANSRLEKISQMPISSLGSKNAILENELLLLEKEL